MIKRKMKPFPTADVLSVLADRLLSENGLSGAYDVAGWMAGEIVYTHQVSRIMREASAVILKIHPHLAPVLEEAKLVTGENWREWIREWKDRYGDEIAVPVMNIAEHERIDPESELAEKVPPHKIINFGGKP